MNQAAQNPGQWQNKLFSTLGYADNALTWAGWRAPTLDADRLIALAQRQTKLSDFGAINAREGLARLIDSLNSEANQNTIGRFFYRQLLLVGLRNLLNVQETRCRTPAIAQQTIQRPIIVIGLPRTGSTLLHTLLCQQDNARYIHLYEGFSMGEPPTPNSLKTDPRIRRLDRWFYLAQSMFTPKLKVIHPLAATAPEECIVLLLQTFECPVVYHLGNHIPTYNAWLEQRDLTPIYRHLKFLLQLLQFKFDNPHWVLKSPGHLRGLDSLLNVFPDACIVHLHRDPLEMLPSWCSFSYFSRALTAKNVDPHAIGREWLHHWAHRMETVETVRRRRSAEIIDVAYRELIADPIAVTQRICQQAGRPITPAAQTRMQQFIAERPQHKFGKHRYSLAQFGLDRSQIESAFVSYLDIYRGLL